MFHFVHPKKFRFILSDTKHFLEPFLTIFKLAVVVRKCFIKHMCFIVLYFHGHAFFSLEIALIFEKCALFL